MTTLSIPRLSPEELPPELAAMLRPRIERLGYLGEFFKCVALTLSFGATDSGF